MRESPTNTRRKAARRGRNTIGTFVLMAIASQAGLAAIVERTGPWLRDPLYADKELKLRARIADCDSPPFVVVQIGSSRTSNGLRPAQMEPVLETKLGRPVVAFNFGIPAAGSIAQALNLSRLLDRGVRPDLVLLEILPTQLSKHIMPPVESFFFRAGRLMSREVPISISYGFPDIETRRQWTVARWIPVYGLRLPMMGRWLPAWIPWNQREDASRNTDSGGWQRPVYDPVTPEQRVGGTARARREYFDILQTLEFGGPTTRALIDSIERCRHERVPVALVLMPEGSEFRAWYPPLAEARLLAFLQSLQTVYGVNVIDARSWLEDESFSDSHHQLSAGAAAFSQRLALAILQAKPDHD